jgi:hypothetical protein
MHSFKFKYHFFFLLIIVILCVSAQPLKNQADIKSPEIKTLSSPKVIMTLPLNDSLYSLTYEISDMGVECDRVPNPIRYISDLGCFFLNPGPSQSQKNLFEKINLDKRVVFHLPIDSLLPNPSDNPKNFINLFYGQKNNVILVYALNLDDNTGIYSNCNACVISQSGKLESVFSLPDLKCGQSIYPNSNGFCWVFNSNLPDFTWSLFDNSKQLKFKVKTSSSIAAPFIDGSLLVFFSEKLVKYCTITGTQSTLNVSGNINHINAIIPGNGNFFAIVNYPEIKSSFKNSVDKINRIEIQICYISFKNKTVFFLPVCDINPSVFGPKDKFKYYDSNTMSIDEKGNLFTIGRNGPDSPAIFIEKYSLTQKAIELLPKE